MPCGTGKTFTSLRVAEEVVPGGGTVLFLAPSLSLVSQTLRAWYADRTRPLTSVVVCSDSSVGRRGKDDLEEHTYDLIAPTTTDAAMIGKYLMPPLPPDGLRVVFATYQSIDKVAAAQQQGTIPEFDLVIADEAHRTAGHGTKEGDRVGSLFQLVHDQLRLRAKHRLYMTATPKVYAAEAKAKAKDYQVEVWSMDDEAVFGPELHHLSFGAAVDRNLLADYRVLVLIEPEGAIASELQEAAGHKQYTVAQYTDAAKLAACWRAFNGIVEREGSHSDEPMGEMRRVVGYTGTIKESIALASFFPEVVQTLFNEDRLRVTHVDGSQSALTRANELAWLRGNPDGDVRMLSNVRCLSEGIDVPALDAVIFFAPRDSMVDVVQSVGRVMRKADDAGKRFGYILIPVPLTEGADLGDELKQRKYQVIWQVINAIRSHDERLTAEINQLKFDKNRVSTRHIDFIGKQAPAIQDSLPYAIDEAARNQLRVRLLERCGEKAYWSDWAENVGDLLRRRLVRARYGMEM